MAVWYKGLPQGSCMAERQDVNYLMLYDEGDECTDVTGGWGSDGYRYISTMAALDVEKLSDSIKIRNTQNGQCRVFGTSNVINLSGYGEIGVIGSNSLPSVAAAAAYVSAKKTYIYDSGIVNSTIVSSNGIISRVDVRAVDKGYVSLICGYTGGALEIGVSAIFLAKVDDWQSWLVKAGLTVSDYGSLDAVIADHTALTTLMSGKAAVDYMLHHCTGTVMAAVVRSQVALDAIADSPYNAQIFDNNHWNKFLRMVEAVPESEKVYLYRYGNEYNELTEGWNSTYNSSGGTSPNANIINSKEMQYLSTQATVINTSGGWAMAFYMASKKQNISEYQVLCASVNVITGCCRCDISNINTHAASTVDNIIALGSAEQGVRIIRVDVSNVASGYLFIGAFVAPNMPSSKVHIYKVWLEK